MTNSDNNLSEEEYCHYSGLPSVQFYENIEKDNMESNNKQQSKGLGDTVAKITNFFGIDKVADAAAKLLGAEGCGCKERRELLNHLFPYETSSRHFKVKKQFTFLDKEFFKGQYIKVTKADDVYNNVIQLVQDGKLEEIL